MNVLNKKNNNKKIVLLKSNWYDVEIYDVFFLLYFCCIWFNFLSYCYIKLYEFFKFNFYIVCKFVLFLI